MHLKKFFAYLQFEKRFSKHTVEAYRSDIEQFTEFLTTNYNNQDNDLLSITHRNVRSWIVFMMGNKVSPKSVNRKISALKTYYKYLNKKGVLDTNPLLKITTPKIAKPIPVFVDKKGMDQVFINMYELPEKTALERYIKSRNIFIIELLYATGIRRAELLDLTENSFDKSKKNVKVHGKGNKERIIPFGNRILEMYNKYLEIRNQVFGTSEYLILSNTGCKAYPKLIYDVVNSILSKNTSLEKKSPHILRHTFATHISNNGAELNAVKELLGHASLASTQVYTHNKIEKLKEIHKTAHPKA